MFGDSSITFYGQTFIAGPTGEIIKKLEDPEEGGVISATFDLDEVAATRAGWGIFRDRRPDLYGPLLTLDGSTNPRS